MLKTNFYHTESKKKRNDDVPQKYFVITNNDIVRVRYLLLLGKPTKRRAPNADTAAIPRASAQTPQASTVAIQSSGRTAQIPRRRPGLLRRFVSNNKAFCTVAAYVLLLLLIGFMHSSTAGYWRYRLWHHIGPYMKWLEAATSTDVDDVFISDSSTSGWTKSASSSSAAADASEL